MTSEGKKFVPNKKGHRNRGVLSISTKRLCHCFFLGGAI